MAPEFFIFYFIFMQFGSLKIEFIVLSVCRYNVLYACQDYKDFDAVLHVCDTFSVKRDLIGYEHKNLIDKDTK